jgi:hypothetical protein
MTVPSGNPLQRRLACRGLLEERLHVEGVDRHANGSILPSPCVPRAVAVELDPVSFRIGKVERLADAVIGGAVKKGARLGQASQGEGERFARRKQHGEVEQPGRSVRAPRLLALDQHEEVAGAGAEPNDPAVVGMDAETEALRVERQRAGEVRDGQAHRPDRGHGSGRSNHCTSQ